MDYLIRFAQAHEEFRLPEVKALALAERIDVEIVAYSLKTPFCIVRLGSEDAARRLVRRAVLVQNIFELWGQGSTLEELHATVKASSAHLWPKYATHSFKFWIDSFCGARTNDQRLDIINGFAYLPLKGRIKMQGAQQEFTVFEDWPLHSDILGILDPSHVYFGRHVGAGARDLPRIFDLKKRKYINTTSMDSELALVTANICMAGPGKLMYDPFAGTGSFPIACAQFGALVFGSDIDGRSIRGHGGSRTVQANFEQYGLLSEIGGFFSADLTNTPIRRLPLGEKHRPGAGRRLFDGIICDPPYGVREGLYVLGVRDPLKTPWKVEKGLQIYKDPEFIPPRKPYSFAAMLDVILTFAAETLVDHGRLSFWMPTANDEDVEMVVPSHPYLELVAVCVQVFNKWSRRLITYQRLPDADVDPCALSSKSARVEIDGLSASDLNPFRKAYFDGFRSSSDRPSLETDESRAKPI